MFLTVHKEILLCISGNFTKFIYHRGLNLSFVVTNDRSSPVLVQQPVYHLAQEVVRNHDVIPVVGDTLVNVGVPNPNVILADLPSISDRTVLRGTRDLLFLLHLLLLFKEAEAVVVAILVGRDSFNPDNLISRVVQLVLMQ